MMKQDNVFSIVIIHILLIQSIKLVSKDVQQDILLSNPHDLASLLVITLILLMTQQIDVSKYVRYLQTITVILIFVNLLAQMDFIEITLPDYVFHNVLSSLYYLLIILQILVLNIALQAKIFSLIT